MKQAYDQSAPKKPTNLSINNDLLSRARSLKLSLSSTLETALAVEVRTAERARWLERNQNAIDASNELAEDKGLFADSSDDQYSGFRLDHTRLLAGIPAQ